MALVFGPASDPQLPPLDPPLPPPLDPPLPPPDDPPLPLLVPPPLPPPDPPPDPPHTLPRGMHACTSVPSAVLTVVHAVSAGQLAPPPHVAAQYVSTPNCAHTPPLQSLSVRHVGQPLPPLPPPLLPPDPPPSSIPSS